MSLTHFAGIFVLVSFAWARRVKLQHAMIETEKTPMASWNPNQHIAASCMEGGVHAYLVFGNTCSNERVGDWKDGCGFEEEGDSAFSRYDGAGFVGSGTALDVLGGFLPGLGNGSVIDQGNRYCDNAITWDVPDVCLRAITAELGPVYDEHRAWTFYKALMPNYWTTRTGYRTDSCGWFRPPKAWTMRKGLLTKPKALCWDFVTDMHDLYCGAQSEHSSAHYRHVCGYSRASWEELPEVSKAQLFKTMEAEKPGLLSNRTKSEVQRILSSVTGEPPMLRPDEKYIAARRAELETSRLRTDGEEPKVPFPSEEYIQKRRAEVEQSSSP